jgi:hypothetical protein
MEEKEKRSAFNVFYFIGSLRETRFKHVTVNCWLPIIPTEMRKFSRFVLRVS